MITRTRAILWASAMILAALAATTLDLSDTVFWALFTGLIGMAIADLYRRQRRCAR